MAKHVTFCCPDFESAFKVTLINPIDGPTGWLLYGTDYETVSIGQPMLRYWPISYCPFCGARLAAPDSSLMTRTRKFGWLDRDGAANGTVRVSRVPSRRRTPGRTRRKRQK